MNEEIKFEAQIKDMGRGGAGVELPFNVSEVFGKKGLVKVHATFDGHPYRGSLAPMGGGKHFLGILKDIRFAIGKQPGDFVCVTLRKDVEPREVEIPEDLLAALKSEPKALEAFNKLSFTHKKEYVKAVIDSKKPETRATRIQKTVVTLTEKSK